MSATTRLLTEVGARISGSVTQNTKSFNLLYKGINKADVEEFHVKCDDMGPTVTILYGKYNTLFGGYTSQNWSSNKRLTKKDNNAFLFYKTGGVGAECVFLPIKKEKAERAITCDANFGPTFGGGILAWETYDLQTFRKSKKSESKDGYLQLNGSLNVACAYDVEDSSEREGSNETRARSRDINSGSMLVKWIEVYQVVDDELSEPWKTTPNDEECDRMRNTLKKMEPLPGLGIKQYNILLIGAIGGGKSSFYNTLATVFSGKVIPHAPARNSSTSVTNEVKAYDIELESGEKLNVRIYDIRGFEDNRGYDHELKPLLDGKLKIGFQFPDLSLPMQTEHLKPAIPNDEIHLVCFVTGISNFDYVTPELRNHIETVKTAIGKKGLPMVVVATKFDDICPKISDKVDHLYKSPKAEIAVKSIADFFGVPRKHVYPVVNYVDEREINVEKDRLALQAIYEMVLLTEAYVKKHAENTGKVEEWTDRVKWLPSLKSEHEKNQQVLRTTELLSGFKNSTLRVLCVGYAHSGKSSFIDAIFSLLNGKISTRVNKGFTFDDNASASSVPITDKFEMYKIKYKNEDGEFLTTNVSFGDLPGFQKEGGMTFGHVKKVINGNVPNKYKIKEGITRKNSKRYIDKPKQEDKIHCVCYVFDVCTVDELEETFVTKFKSFQSFLRRKGIPYVVILTKADKLSVAVKENCLQVFENKAVKEVKDKLLKMFSFLESKIFPVINYIHQNRVNPDMDALLLNVFREILDLGRGYLDDLSNEEEDISDGDEVNDDSE